MSSFTLKVFDWSLVDVDEINDLEERFFQHRFDTVDVNVDLVSKFRTSPTIKPKRVKRRLLRGDKGKEIKIDVPSYVKGLSERIEKRKTFKTLHEHVHCYRKTKTLLQYSKKTDYPVLLKEHFTNSQMCSIFDSFKKTPLCNKMADKQPNLVFVSFFKHMENDLQEFKAILDEGRSIIDFDFKLILRLKDLYRMFDYVKPSHFIDFCVLILLQLYERELSFILLVTILDRIERCLSTNIVPLCPGIMIYAPCGTGKTTFLHSTSCFLLDTDFLSTSLIRKNPEILSRLLESGFSILSNLEVFDLVSLTHLVFCVTVMEKILKNRLFSKGIFFEYKKQKREFLRARYKEYFFREAAKCSVEDVLRDRSRAMIVLPTVELRGDQTLADGLCAIYLAIYLK